MVPLARTAAALLLLSQAVLADKNPEKVKIATPDGAVIAATYFDGGHGGPGVLLFPMCRPDAMEGWEPVAKRLEAAGISSLAIVYPGYGESTQPPNARGDQRAAHADAALRYLQSRIGESAGIAVAGSSCGVQHALGTAVRNPQHIRAAVLLTGPHTIGQLEHVRNTPALAVFAGAAEGDTPAPEWARALKEASRHPASRSTIAPGRAHGTDIFAGQPALATEIADWLALRLKD